MNPPRRHPHRRWRHRWRHSLRLRLITVFVLLAMTMAAVFLGGMQRAFSTGWREAAQPLVGDYMDRLVAELGTPPDVARAEALVTRLPISIRIEGPASRVTLTGTASVPAREFDLKGVASLTSLPNAPPGFDLPFVIQGPWDDPLIFPDSESLIRRSPASAPLLDAVKDRKTRDAVRSVLERFTGGQRPAAPDAAPAAEAAKPN